MWAKLLFYGFKWNSYDKKNAKHSNRKLWYNQTNCNDENCNWYISILFISTSNKNNGKFFQIVHCSSKPPVKYLVYRVLLWNYFFWPRDIRSLNLYKLCILLTEFVCHNYAWKSKAYKLKSKRDMKRDKILLKSIEAIWRQCYIWNILKMAQKAIKTRNSA